MTACTRPTPVPRADSYRKTELATLRAGDYFKFDPTGPVYTYHGNGWYGRPYCGGPWLHEGDDTVLLLGG